MYDELVKKKVNTTDINELIEKTDYNAKINEIKCEISSIAGLDTTVVLNAAKNVILNVIHLVKKNR